MVAVQAAFWQEIGINHIKDVFSMEVKVEEDGIKSKTKKTSAAF